MALRAGPPPIILIMTVDGYVNVLTRGYVFMQGEGGAEHSLYGPRVSA